MIGQADTLIEVFGICIGLFFLAVGVAYMRIPGQRKKAFAMTLFSCVFLLMSSFAFGIAWRHRQELRTLDPAQVTEIRVADQTFTDSVRIRQIATALHSVVAFSPHHQAEPDIPMTITLSDGTAYKLRIKYRKGTYEEGVVLRFTPHAPEDGGWEHGYAFSASLLPVLRTLGVDVQP